MRKPRLRAVRWPARGHTASRWAELGLTPGCLEAESMHLTPKAQILLQKYHSPLRGAMFPGEMADSWSGAGEPGSSHYSREQGGIRNDGHVSREPLVQLYGTCNVQIWDNFSMRNYRSWLLYIEWLKFPESTGTLETEGERERRRKGKRERNKKKELL